MKIALAGVGLVSGTVSNSVTVNNGLHALSSVKIPGPIGEGVVITPLRPQPVIKKCSLKFALEVIKRIDSKMFTLTTLS